MNPFRQLFAGTGQMPPSVRSAVTSEGPLFLEEGLHGVITYRNYRRPRVYKGIGKRAVTGTIAITPQRFVVWTVAGEMIDIPLSHPLRAAITVTEDQPGQVCFAYRAESFRPDRSGTVEIRLRTPQAPQVIALLTPAS